MLRTLPPQLFSLACGGRRFQLAAACASAVLSSDGALL
jgi:hypothetical protein